jgi:hypothetical protein
MELFTRIRSESMQAHSSRWPVWALVLAGAFARLLPHPPNFTPVGGLSIFAGARIAGWQAYLVPLVILTITSPILAQIYGFRAFGRSTPVVYGSFLIAVWIGRRLAKRVTPLRVGAAAFLCSLQFYLITNFVWFPGGLYPQTLEGVMASYTAGLPYFGRTLLGDLLYSALFFGSHALLKRREARTAPAV